MKRTPRIGTALAALVVAGLAWWLLAPTQLGGSTGYAVVVGQSMEPEIERGDLVLVRQRGEYGVGDVVLYDNREARPKRAPSHRRHRGWPLRAEG